jgi:hypothetical protein
MSALLSTAAKKRKKSLYRKKSFRSINIRHHERKLIYAIIKNLKQVLTRKGSGDHQAKRSRKEGGNL